MTARAARVRAQAKVNLFLRVLAREESGFHQLETLFCRLELADRVEVRVGGAARTLACDGPAMPAEGLGPPERNLAYRAAEAYAEVAGWPTGFEIAVEKHIPAGGGLGGGSADAGAVLRALNAISPRPQPAARLLDIAAGLGADVPFLTSQSALALAWGRGERMLELPALPVRDVVLAFLGFGVSTAEAFGWLASARRESTLLPRSRLLAPADLSSWDAVARLAANDLEPVVAARHPAIANTLAFFRDSGVSLGSRAPILVRMTGSGSTVFAVFGGVGEIYVENVGNSGGPGLGMAGTRTAGRVEEVEIMD